MIMRYEEEPLGCFQLMSYALVGLGLYVFCSLFSCIGLTSAIWQININSGHRAANDYDAFTPLIMLAFSFLCIGPLMIVAYVLYLEDIRVIEPLEPFELSPQRDRDKPKNSEFTE